MKEKDFDHKFGVDDSDLFRSNILAQIYLLKA